MIHKLNPSSSFSSFSSTDQLQLPLQFPSSIHEKQVHLPKKQKYNSSSISSFSPFENHNMRVANLQKIKINQLNASKTIGKLKNQIESLKKCNQKLTEINVKLKQQIERLTDQKGRQQTQLYIMREQQQQKYGRKERTQQLLKQTLKIKQTMYTVRQQCQKYQTLCSQLQAKISADQKQSKQSAWKQNFIILFIDMLSKISNDIEPEWNNKKKIQIGWKIVKNLIQKAFVSGIKPPRVEKSCI